MERATALQKVVKLHALYHGSDVPGEKEAAKRQALKLCEIHGITRTELRQARGAASQQSQQSQSKPRTKPTQSQIDTLDSIIRSWHIYSNYQKEVIIEIIRDDPVLQAAADERVRVYQEAMRREKQHYNYIHQRSEEEILRRQRERDRNNAVFIVLTCLTIGLIIGIILFS